MAIWYHKKKDILEKMWKNGKDYKLLDRLISSWVVITDGYRYAIYKEYMESRVEELEKEIKNLKEKDGINAIKKEEIAVQSAVSDSELLDHLRYLYYRNEAKLEGLNNVVLMYYHKNSDKWFDECLEKVYKMIGYEEDPSEKDELEYIKSII